MTWQSAVERTVTGMGYDLVDAEKGAGGLLRVYIDHLPAPAGAPAQRFITVDDCERVTRQLQHVLEVDGCAYERLEVSSPGLDRPLKKAADYARFVGEQVEVTLKLPFKGRKRYSGELCERPDGWRLLLVPAAPAKAGAAGARKAQGKLAAKPASAPVQADATGELALDFSLDEVREARLVAVVDFKGRRFAAEHGPAAQDTRPHEEVDGGRLQ